MISELFQPDLVLIKQNGTYNDISDFFLDLFNRQESWESSLVDAPYAGLYSPDRASGSLKTRSFPLTGAAWVEYQLYLDSAFGFAKPINTILDAYNSGKINIANATFLLTRMGIYRRPTNNMGQPITTLIASDGTVLATGLDTALQWQNGYNNLLVPYERAQIRATTPGNFLPRYIKALAPVGENVLYFRTSTFKFDGTA